MMFPGLRGVEAKVVRSRPLLNVNYDDNYNDDRRGAWWLIGRFNTIRLKGHGIESRSTWNKGTLGKSFTRSCLRRFGVKLRDRIRAVSAAPLSSSQLEE